MQKYKWPIKKYKVASIEEMFNIHGHQGNTNGNYIEIPPHPRQSGYHQEPKQ
jgi:hypothetical protein